MSSATAAAIMRVSLIEAESNLVRLGAELGLGDDGDDNHDYCEDGVVQSCELLCN